MPNLTLNPRARQQTTLPSLQAPIEKETHDISWSCKAGSTTSTRHQRAATVPHSPNPITATARLPSRQARRQPSADKAPKNRWRHHEAEAGTAASPGPQARRDIYQPADEAHNYQGSSPTSTRMDNWTLADPVALAVQGWRRNEVNEFLQARNL